MKGSTPSLSSLLTLAAICLIGASHAAGAGSLSAANPSWICDLEQDGCLERVFATWQGSVLQLRLESGVLLAEVEGIEPGTTIELAERDGDGLPDLVAGERMLLDGRYWLAAGSRSINGFEEKWNTGGVLRNVWDSDVGDLDGDGLQEIVGQAYYYPGTLVRVFENAGDDAFAETWASPEQGTPSIVAVGLGETDGDGQKEILAGVAGTLGTLYMWENVGDNLFEARPLGFQMDWQVRDLDAGDTDHDGKREIIGVGSSSTDGGSLKIFERSGAVGQNTYANVYDYDTVSYLLGCTVGDADNDGNEEMLLNVGGWAGFPTYIRRIEYNPGLGIWEHKLFEASTTGLPISAAIGDFDGDGENELAIGSTEVIHIYESTADDSFTPVWSSSFAIPGNIMDMTIGPDSEYGYPMLAACSFDGQVDLVGFNGSSYVRLMEAPLQIGDPLRSIDAGFFDGADARLDLVVARSGSDLVSHFEETIATAADWPEAFDGGLQLGLIGNPFRARTSIHFSAPSSAGPLALRVYDLSGRLVRELARSAAPGETHVLAWDGSDQGGATLPSGVYLLRLGAGGEIATARAVLIR